jgi:truncated hemoglobin YjbI
VLADVYTYPLECALLDTVIWYEMARNRFALDQASDQAWRLGRPIEANGTHARIGFTAHKEPKRVPDRRDTYVGTAITVLDNRGICAHSGFCTDRFNAVFHVDEEPLLHPLFAEILPDHPERVAAWLGEVFRGPTNYSEQYGGYPRMLSQHVDKQISEAQRQRWVSLLSQAADEAGVPAGPEFRTAFMSHVEWGSRLAAENSAANAHPPRHMPMPHWNWGTAGPPGSRVSALAPLQEEETTVTLPSADEPVRFSLHIKPLFRSMDRQSMKWAFDL